MGQEQRVTISADHPLLIRMFCEWARPSREGWRLKPLCIILGLLTCMGCNGAHSLMQTSPNHHLHNFQIELDTHINHDHALAMGYGMITRAKPENPAYSSLGLIKLSNNGNCPVRVHGNKQTGKVTLTYHQHQESRTEGLNAYALQLGLRREIGKRYPLTEEDLELIRRMALACRDISNMTLETADLDYFRVHFNNSWPLETPKEESFNLAMNWQNRRVVECAVQAWRDDFPWEKYEAIFLDSLQAGYVELPSAQADYWGGELFPSRRAGNQFFLEKLSGMSRDQELTGREQRPWLLTNVYHTIRNPDVHRVYLEWYASGRLRFDHYYIEAGGLHGDFEANGVVPGTQQPAYVDPEAPQTAWAPASLFAVDDFYTWSRLKSRKPDFDHAAFFEQHRHAAIIAMRQGSWFGWYGEDYVAQKDVAGRSIYPPALQLLRAMPNYENMAGVPINPADGCRPGAERHADLEAGTYQSLNSRIETGFIVSRNPLNQEYYIVYLEPNGSWKIPRGMQLDQAWLCDAWFGKIEERPDLTISKSDRRLSLGDSALVGRAIRLRLQPAPR